MIFFSFRQEQIAIKSIKDASKKGDTASAKLLCQYIGFFSKLRESASWEVRLLSEIVARDAQSEAEFKINPWSRNVQSFKLVDIRNPLPEVDD